MTLVRVILTLWFCLTASLTFAQDRVALVLGNSQYRSAKPLANATNDARDVSQALRSIGFVVFDGYDLTRAETLRLASQMARRLTPDDIAVVYYAGHGVQVGTQNYLLPVDAAGQSYDTIKDSSVSLRAVLREIELRADTNIVLLDACRNNPFETQLQTRSGGPVAQGLARVDAAVGSFIAFATQPGNVALDGTERNSPFTQALLKHIGSAEDDLHEVMRKVRREVVAATGSVQVPWENSSLIDKVYLAARVQPGQQAQPQTALVTPAPVIQQPVAQPQARVIPVPQPQQQAALYTHVVRGLDPNGDGFLALREGTWSGARRITKMLEGTRLRFLSQNGLWMQVQTETGLTGWAHTNWIAPLATQIVPQQTQSATSCDALWYQRNEIFARRGYCFQSARGQQTFGNVGCLAGVPASGIPLTSQERARVNALLAQETAMGCR